MATSSGRGLLAFHIGLLSACLGGLLYLALQCQVVATPPLSTARESGCVEWDSAKNLKAVAVPCNAAEEGGWLSPR
jgi:hypothetical protein